jgi:hypothetical protein
MMIERRALAAGIATNISAHSLAQLDNDLPAERPQAGGRAARHWGSWSLSPAVYQS